MQLIDTHCHLASFVNTGEIDNILLRASVDDVKYFIVIGTNLTDWEVNAKLVEHYNNIAYTIGLHPAYACSNISLNFDSFMVNKHTICAIGEIGLDYHFLSDDLNRDKIVSAQKRVFYEQLKFAKIHDFPVVIHSRDAFDDTFEILLNSGINGDKILFHCFAYSDYEMNILKEFGTYVSFSGIVTYKNASSIREALKIADRSKILLETDCPYLAPVPFRGKQNEPAFIRQTAEFVRNFLNDETLLDQIFDNSVRFFGLKQ